MTDFIGYEALTHAAMRGVIREAIRSVGRNSQPPGDHHFYITFRTRFPGVEIADYLVEQFPNDMTIVIQHQFWDLEAHDSHFEIVLKFAGVPQHLRVPYGAISRFVDPSVNFGLSFEEETVAPADRDVISPARAQPAAAQATAPAKGEAPGTVVSIDAFRRK